MHISTIIKDIYKRVEQKDGWFTDELAASYTVDISKRLQEHYNDPRNKGRLRMSGLGPKCPRQLWYSVHHPELGEPLPATALLKFSYGHLIEAQTVMMAKAAGHEVTGEQDELELDGVLGHRDCVIDGCVVDVKSSSSQSFRDFQTLDYSRFDKFGYLDQLDAYVVASHGDPLVRTKDRGYILAVDKQLGKMHLYEHIVRPEHIRSRVKEYHRIVALSEAPRCECGTIDVGKSGNVKLDTRASYSAFKYCCFPNLRCFIYSNSIEYFTVVKKMPQRSDGSFLKEIDRHGNYVYN